MAAPKYPIPAGNTNRDTAFNFKAGAPLDSRFVVDYIQSLISYNGWWDSDGNTYKFYKGESVYVYDTIKNVKGLYTLRDYDGLASHAMPDASIDQLSDASLMEEIGKYWDRAATASDLEHAVQDLGPVFIFKGIATHISDDKRIITTQNAQYIPNGKEEPVSIYCLGVEPGFPEEYYGWGTSNTAKSITTYFYSDSSIITTSSIQYKKGSSVNIFYVDDKMSKRFYYDGNVANQSTETGDPSVLWKFTDDADISHIYTVGANTPPSEDSSNITFYMEPNTRGLVYDTSLNITHFQSHDFVPQTQQEKGTIVSGSTGTVVVASDKNNGWVYQLNEDEYASNGYIWVQLGSADQEWVII
jgi:hypothetical protein